MAYKTGPYTPAINQPLQIENPAGAPGVYNALQVINYSSYELDVTGTGAQLTSVPATSFQTVPLAPSAAPVDLIPRDAGQPSTGGKIWVIWLTPDDPQDKLPAGLPSTTVNLAQGSSVNVSAGTVQVQNVPNGVVSTFVKSPPAVNTIVTKGNTGATTRNITFATAAAGSGTGAGLGSLGLAIVIAEVTAPAFPASLTISGGPAAWTWVNPTVSSPISTDFVLFLGYGILTQDILTNGITYTLTGAAGVGFGADQWGTATIGSGGNLAFSNQNLSGLVTGPITWSSTGTSNANLVLPSASPGLMVCTSGYQAGAPTSSIGKFYAIVAGGVSFWIASNQTGALSVQTSANPESPNNPTVGDIGMVIPQ